MFTNSGLRDLDAAATNRLGQSSLWKHSISGDLPIVLVQVVGVDDEKLVGQLVRWHTYMRRRGLKLDLVILDERAGEPADRLRKELETGIAEMFGKPGGVFFLTRDKVPAEDAVLLAAAARAVILGDRGSLSEQIDHRTAASRADAIIRSEFGRDKTVEQANRPPLGLSFWNGFGGFTRDGLEYVIVIDGTSPSGPDCRRLPGRMFWPIRGSDVW